MTRHAAVRVAAMAVIAAGGALLKSTPASAAPQAKSACDDYAAGYAAGYCSAQGKSVSAYSYTCTSPTAHPFQINVICG